ncbi:MAG TPA: hypothetical protein VK742_10560 [Candidatus Sulfotelmatobacter sp.]|nr:hypothetical protein [Candidatus Sulfotelmatobacter sp.]
MKKLLFLVAVAGLISWCFTTPDGSSATASATPSSSGNPYPSATSKMGNTNTTVVSEISH